MGKCVFSTYSKEGRFDHRFHSGGEGICWRLAQSASSCSHHNGFLAQISNELEKTWVFRADGKIPQNSGDLLYRLLSKPPQKR